MDDRATAGRRAASPAAEEAPKKQKVGYTDHVRNANDVHTNWHCTDPAAPPVTLAARAATLPGPETTVFLAVKRPARPWKSTAESFTSRGNTGAAYAP